MTCASCYAARVCQRPAACPSYGPQFVPTFLALIRAEAARRAQAGALPVSAKRETR